MTQHAIPQQLAPEDLSHFLSCEKPIASCQYCSELIELTPTPRNKR